MAPDIPLLVATVLSFLPQSYMAFSSFSVSPLGFLEGNLSLALGHIWIIQDNFILGSLTTSVYDPFANKVTLMGSGSQDMEMSF